MTTENSFSNSKLTHSQSSLKTTHGKADTLKELFKCVSESNLAELTRLLEANEMAEKSMNIILGKAFSYYSSSNKDSKDVIRVLLE